MDERDVLARQFERHRAHLQAVAWRMLGSGDDAQDAVQEAWLRLSRSDVSGVDDLGRWLTTVVGRVCLDRLRARRLRREQPFPEPDAPGLPASGPDPEQQAQLSESVGLALMVVLDTLEPAERLAFVLHDIFAVPFAEIAPLVERSPAAAKMLASRARRRLQGADTIAGPDAIAAAEAMAGASTVTGGPITGEAAARQRAVVRAFLSASRQGRFDALLALLDPDVRFRADAAAIAAGAPAGTDGARAVARLFSGRAQGARPALVDGEAGAVWTHRAAPAGAFSFTLTGGRITAIDLVADPRRLARMSLAFLPGHNGHHKGGHDRRHTRENGPARPVSPGVP